MNFIIKMENFLNYLKTYFSEKSIGEIIFLLHVLKTFILISFYSNKLRLF